MNGRHVAEPRSQEFKQFLLLEAVLAEMGYHAFRTEVCLFHYGLVVAGQLDALFANSVGELCLLDWKRCPRRAGALFGDRSDWKPNTGVKSRRPRDPPPSIALLLEM